MNLVSILGILTIGGAVCVAFLTHRLLGFRPAKGDQIRAANVELASMGKARAEDGDLTNFVDQLQDQVFRLEEEVRELRVGALRTDERLLLADESRRVRERELSRRHERGLERHRERELEESTYQMRDIERPLAAG
ncbi:MAG TPA: hypothetical protein VMH33_02795 [Solirubrobacterales bacterium]|nr:hypothetical protein [Solirubrobacterales bacterium]